jgi:phage terminase large subunit-like protein
LEVVWCDEEPPEDLYFEGLTRTNETNGIVYITFTPAAGMTNVVRMFLSEGIRI